MGNNNLISKGDKEMAAQRTRTNRTQKAQKAEPAKISGSFKIIRAYEFNDGTISFDMDFEGADHVTAEIEDQSVISLASVGGKLVNLLFTLCGSPAAQPGRIFDDIDNPDGAVLRLYDLRPVGFGLGQELFVMFEFKAVIDLKCECHCIFLPIALLKAGPSHIIQGSPASHYI